MPEFLKDKATEWFRNNREPWRSWEHFKECFHRFFVPKRMQIQLEKDMQKHHQGQQNIRDYIISMQSLMRFLVDYTPVKKLEWIYQNLNPDYKAFIRPKDFKNLKDLIELGEIFEENQAERKRLYSSRHSGRAFAAEEKCHTGGQTRPQTNKPDYSRSFCCWNCGDRNHKMNECPELKQSS